MPQSSPPPPRRRQILAGAGAALAAAWLAPGTALARSDPRWAQVFAPQATATRAAPRAGLGAWAALVERHLATGGDGVARLAYGAVSPAEHQALKAWIATQAEGDPRALPSATAQFVWWVNLYNALTVDVVLDHYPVASIKAIEPGDIPGGSGAASFAGLFVEEGPWRAPLVTVAGHRLSLDDIEHGVLRPVWRDNRVHYAVNCAAIGCPNLRLWQAEALEDQLQAAAAAYVNDPRGVSADAQSLVVSSIYHWFQEDFGDSRQGVVDHLRAHAAGETARQLLRHSRYDSHRYDWALNDATA